MIRKVLLFFATIIAVPAALALNPREVRVTTELVHAGDQLVPEVRVAAAADGTQTVEVKLTNRLPHDVQLRAATVELPWLGRPTNTTEIAAGSSATGRWPPTRVFEPAKHDGEPVSGMYLLARDQSQCSLAGFVSWRTFWSKLHDRDGTLVVTADGEDRRIRPGETVALETVWLAAGADWQGLLFRYGDAIAKSLHLRSKPPRRFVGWSTWDYYGRDWRAADVTENLTALRQLVPGANLLQIDGGWWQARGDYLAPRADLGPDGMKHLAGEIRGVGLTAGLHLDGMRAAADSKVVTQHPDYFLHDDQGHLLRERAGVGGDQPNVFFDYSNPGACAYMRDALRRIRREWGFDYFKLDFLRAGIAEDVRRAALDRNSPRRIVPFDPALTSVERLHRALAAFRDGIGEDAFLLGCSTPFGPTFGHVDAIRTGPDIAPKFTQYRSDCEATAGEFYLDGRVVQVDADYEVVRAKEDQDATRVHNRGKDGGALALNEAEMWTDYVALFGGTKLASDKLTILRPERKSLVRFALTQPNCTRWVPLDFWQHARKPSDAYEVFLGEAPDGLVLALFNWSEGAREYLVSGVPAGWPGKDALYRGKAEVEMEGGRPTVRLAAHHAAILRLPAGMAFDVARRSVDVQTRNVVRETRDQRPETRDQ